MSVSNLQQQAVRLAEAKRVIEGAIAGEGLVDARLVELSALGLAEIRVDAHEQLRLMLGAARYFYVSGNAFKAIPIAQKARQLGLEAALPTQTTDALIAIGICSADSAGLATAMEAYADALALARGQQDRVREAKIWQNLGAALLYGGVYREALSCFRESLRISEGDASLNSLSAGTLTNIALGHLHLGEISQGLVAIRSAVEFPVDQKDSFSALNRVLAENCFTRLLVEAGDYQGASEHARTARHFSGLANSPRAAISASVAEGLAEVFSGKSDLGLSRLEGTLERARALKVNGRDTLAALVQAYEHVGSPGKALIFLKQLLEQQKETQEQNVLKHVKLHLERLHEDVEDEVAALKRLQTREEILEGRLAKQELTQKSQALFLAQVEVMERLAVAAELRDDSTGEHSYRVGRMSALLAKEFGCDDDTIFTIDIAARLHDIGKIGIPDGILMKRGPLNPSEREVMKTHATIGAEVLAKSNIPHVKMAEEIARHHHEWWDGTGYPGSLSGSGIPIASRITALADVFDALTHSRPYKQAWTIDSALAEILSLRGRQFDPELTDLFLALVSRLRREHDDLDAFLGMAARNSAFLQAREKINKTLEERGDGFPGAQTRFDMQR